MSRTSRPGLAVLVLGALLTLGPVRPATAAPDRTITYSVAVRGEITADVETFAAHAAATLADARGWSLGGAVAYQRVPSGGDFTLWLAEASTLPSFGPPCSSQWSCRSGRNVIVNETRWRTATPTWPHGLDQYQHYVVIHEVGHWLGLGHASCPGAGQPAPVMVQQSKGLSGCLFNTWPLEHERQQVARNLGVLARPVEPPSRWHPVELLPGAGVRSSPDATAVRGAPTVAFAIRGPGGNIYTQGWNGERWSGYVSIGAPPVGLAEGASPSIASWAPGRYDVFVRGSDGKLWQRFSTDGGLHWSAWSKPFDVGVLASNPDVVAWGPDRLDVFVRGTDGQLWQQFWNGATWSARWLPHGGVVTGDPTVASWTAGRLDVFVRGADGRLYQRFWDGATWSAWSLPPGTASGTLGAPTVDGGTIDAASWGLGHLTVLTRGTDGRLYQTSYGGGWSGWVALPEGRIQNGPAVTSTGAARLDVLVQGTDDQAYRFRFGP